MIFLKPLSNWTLDTGLKVDGGALSLDNLVAEDFFDGSAIGTDLWDTQLVQGSGSASIVVANGFAKIKTTAADAAAILTYKAGLDRTKRWRVRFKVRAYQNGVALTLQDDPAYPLPATVTTWHDKSIIELAPDAAGKLYLGRWSTVGTQQLWSSHDGWGSSYRGYFDVFQSLWYEIESDGTNCIIRLLDTDGNVLIATYMPWSDVRAQADDMWAVAGDPFTSIWTTEMDVYEFRHFGPYPSGLVAAMGEIEGHGCRIDQVPITESVDAGGNIEYRYDLDRAGWSAPKTLSELQEDLVGRRFNYLDLEATFTSDGSAQANLDINGEAIADTDAVFNLPLEAIELPGLEVIEL